MKPIDEAEKHPKPLCCFWLLANTRPSSVHTIFPRVASTFANYPEIENPEYCVGQPLYPGWDSDRDSGVEDTNAEALWYGNDFGQDVF